MSGHDLEEVSRAMEALTAGDTIDAPCQSIDASCQSARMKAIPEAMDFGVHNTKTLAILIAATDEPMRASVSGWSTQKHRLPAFFQLSQGELTRAVKKIMAWIGHPLCPYDLDNGVCGRFNVCHAERLLTADWFLMGVQTGSIEIVISKAPCSDCWRYLACLEMTLGVEIRMILGTHYMRKEREDSIFLEWLLKSAELD